MNAPDAVLKRVRLWAEHGLQSQLSDLVAAVAHIDAQADHITALTAEVFEWRECAQYDATMEGPVFKGWDRSQMDRCRKRFNEADAIAAGAHKPQIITGQSSPPRKEQANDR